MYKLLTLIAFILLVIFAPIGLAFGIVTKSGEPYYKGISLAADQFGNTICSELFDVILIKKTGWKFGNPLQTVSFVLEKNKEAGTLRMLGKILTGILIKLKDPAIK